MNQFFSSGIHTFEHGGCDLCGATANVLDREGQAEFCKGVIFTGFGIETDELKSAESVE